MEAAHAPKQLPHAPSTLILVDWDDTLLCSSILTEKGFRLDRTKPLDAATIADLNALEQDAIRFLDACQVSEPEVPTLPMHAFPADQHT